MSKSPWGRRRRSTIDWPVTIVTAWIVIMSGVLVGSVLSGFLGR